MRPFAFERARSLTAAAASGGRLGAQYVAGGTNLIDLMKSDVERPSTVIDINALPYRQIQIQDGTLIIGALARMSDVALNNDVIKGFPAIAQALNASASPQLRNMASIGGNVLQRTRCPYFRDVTQPCNKRNPGSGCGAIGGDNRMEAVLGISDHCIATHPSDLAVALAALDAQIHLSNGKNERVVALTEFYKLPGATPQVENVLRRGELITVVSVPHGLAHKSIYLKVRDRSQYEFALASAAVALSLQGGRIKAARIAVGGVGTVPWRAQTAEAALVGAAPDDEAFARAGTLALAGAKGNGQNDFKIILAQRTVVRALRHAAELHA